MTQFLIYSSEDFKARYLELTAEKIQDQPLKSANGTGLMVGSSRLTQILADQIMVEFPTIKIVTTFPVDWVSIEGAKI